jgi:multicomponent K+:H+ antiporter subunit G
MMMLVVELLAALLMLAGAFFALVGSIGLVRLSDFYRRLHGPTKASTLGVGCILVASILLAYAITDRFAVHELLITLFIFVTAPISASLLIRAARKSDQAKTVGGEAKFPPE